MRTNTVSILLIWLREHLRLGCSRTSRANSIGLLRRNLDLSQVRKVLCLLTISPCPEKMNSVTSRVLSWLDSYLSMKVGMIESNWIYLFRYMIWWVLLLWERNKLLTVDYSINSLSFLPSFHPMPNSKGSTVLFFAINYMDSTLRKLNQKLKIWVNS
jgi:hypothetical protein